MSKSTEKITTDVVEEAAHFIKSIINCSPKTAIMCSSDLDTFSDILGLKQKITISYSKIPHFPKVRTGRPRQLVFGYMYKMPILVLQGKLHIYEGYTLHQCTMIIYILKTLGVHYLLLGNTAGAVNPQYNIGDILLIQKHVYLLGFYDLNPADEPFNEINGPRFVNRKSVYDKTLINKSMEILSKDLRLNDSVRLGTYAFVSGPNYQTVAEVKCLKTCNVDAVGMCIVPEVLAARRCGMTVFAFSLITNMCAQDYYNDEEIDHDDIIHISNERSAVLKVFVEKLIAYLNMLIDTKHGDS